MIDEKKLKTIREDCIDFVRHDVGDPDDLISSLYNLLHKEVTGEEYDYFFHWANKAGYEVNEHLWEDKNNG